MEKRNCFIFGPDLTPDERAAVSLVVGQAITTLREVAPGVTIVCFDSEHAFETAKNPLVGHEAEPYGEGIPPRAELPRGPFSGIVSEGAAAALSSSGD